MSNEQNDEEAQAPLFDLTPYYTPAEENIEHARLKRGLWTARKAAMIRRYLLQFVQITRHGAYIDAFAGPQNVSDPESWTARLVPQIRLLQKLFYFEKGQQQFQLLSEMIASLSHEQAPERIQIFQGDVNDELPAFLKSRPIREKEATFCLFDQRTMECDWETVKNVAGYKDERKIECFYFLANSWLDRALSGAKSQTVEAWFGSGDWESVISLKGIRRAEVFTEKFKTLGYRFAVPYPIYESPSSPKIMYFMIHATDHPAAPTLMTRAYNRAVEPLSTAEQLELTSLFGRCEEEG